MDDVLRYFFGDKRLFQTKRKKAYHLDSHKFHPRTVQEIYAEKGVIFVPIMINPLLSTWGKEVQNYNFFIQHKKIA